MIMIHPQVQLRHPPGRRYVVTEFSLGIFAGIYFSGLILLFVLQSPPPLCKWFHWIDTEQPEWARKEVEAKHRRAWARFFEEERLEKVRANEKAERERQIRELRAEQARNREANQKRMDDEAARRYAEEEVRREAREAERKRLRERAAEAQAAEERGDKSGKWPRWTQGK